MRVENSILDIKIDCLDYYPNKVFLKGIFCELLGGIYKMDVKDKTVVDIGAYYGETAIYYSRLGAKEVFAYEPFKSESFISDNALLNKCNNIKSYRAAVGEKDDVLNCDSNFENDSETRIYYADRKSTRLNSSHVSESRMPSSA